MEYVARAQLDAGERERRVEMLRAAAAEAKAEAASTLLGAERENIVASLGAKGEQEQNGNSHSTATLTPAESDEQQAAPTMAETATAPLPNGDIDAEMADGDTGASSSSDPLPTQPETEEVLAAEPHCPLTITVKLITHLRTRKRIQKLQRLQRRPLHLPPFLNRDQKSALYLSPMTSM